MLLAGTDLVEIRRIQKSMKNPRFCERILGVEEYSQLQSRGFPAQSVAASFCAKEAFSKAVGTGLGAFDLREAQLLRDASGKPSLYLSGRALNLAACARFSVSVTHTAEYASAVVVGELKTSGGTAGLLERERATEGFCILKELLKPRAADSNKGDYGRLACVCGSEGMAGAAVMSAGAAVRCGTGIVDVALPRPIYPIVASRLAEPVFTLLDILPDGELSEAGKTALLASLKKASACLIGCGLGKSRVARSLMALVLQSAQVPLVVDADGINIISENINSIDPVRTPMIFTPHPGEMARLMKTTPDDIQANREAYALDFARRYGVILVLKGYGTLVAAPDGRVYRNGTGNPGMAKGGSGDVLAGMIASFAAQGAKPFQAAAGGVFLHGLAGDRCAEKLSQYAMLPTDIIGCLSELFLELGR